MITYTDLLSKDYLKIADTLYKVLKTLKFCRGGKYAS